MESLSLPKVLESYHGSHLMFPGISTTRDLSSNQIEYFPRKLYFKEFLSNVTSNTNKIPSNGLMDNSFASKTLKAEPPQNLEPLEHQNKENFSPNVPIDVLGPKRKQLQQLNNFTNEDYSSPVHRQVRAVQGKFSDFLTQRDNLDGQNNQPFDEWHTPEKRFHTVCENHENAKQSKFAEMKSQVVEAEFSRLSNDYQILEILGKGSFGKVYRCINKIDNGEYAIKETIRNFTGKYKAYGLNETHALASLTAFEDNTNVVRYFNSWIEDDKLYLVMEYCPSSLKEERKSKGCCYPEAEVKKILRDTCLALSYLHRHNIVHLDVKPGKLVFCVETYVKENILISKNKKYKLADMGQSRVAKIRSEDIEEGDARYVAAELLNCEDDEDLIDVKKADIFSLGMTIYELITSSSQIFNSLSDI